MKKNSRLLCCSIFLNIIMVLMFAVLAYHKRSTIKTKAFTVIENILENKNYKEINKSINDQHYKDEVTPQKRYLAIGFDDFRESDFDMVIPLLKEYGATATFNRIAWNDNPSKKDLYNISLVFQNGNELGDHTWFHYNHVFGEPLCNGQNPIQIEGNQIPFPSNEQLRNNYGNGKNAFGLDLNSTIVAANYGWIGYYNNLGFNSTWKNLTDEQCQKIRDSFSIYKDNSGKLELFDRLSNKYLGTKGSSFGSWDNEKGCYTGGIFTGAKTSCNHEIWERLIQITKLYYQDIWNKDFQFTTWSWPGDWVSPFHFTKDGKYYYDEQCTKLVNYMAEFQSSITGEKRSFTSVLYRGGYNLTHDTIFPSRNDGTQKTMMSNQLILNANLSRKNAITYSTNTYVSYDKIAFEYPEEFFINNSKTKAAQMYDGKGSFYTFLEKLRQNTSNGMIQGEVIDSSDTYSERVFLEELLRYCKETGVEVISKAKAYDVCFNHPVFEGNLIYNPDLINTAKEFLKDADNVPENPDGYIGDCKVCISNGLKSLNVSGKASYLHYGIPLGKIIYSASVIGHGNITIYAIKNNTLVDYVESDLIKLGKIEIKSSLPQNYSIDFLIPDNPETEYEQICGGLGEKIMGIKIVYSGELEVSDIYLKKY